MENSKKIVLLWVLDILREYSDENHLLTYNDIKERLIQKHNVNPNVKSIASNIETLEAYGYEVIKVGNKGCYLGYRDFEAGEIMYLVDAVNSSRAISFTHAKDLINRITKNESKYNKNKYRPILKDENNLKSYNRQMFYVIEVLSDAIDKGLKVSFNYNYYTEEKEFKPKDEGKVYVINPYHLVNSRGKYYLVCNNDKYQNISNYKVENISNITLLEEQAKEINTLNNIKSFDLNEYVKEHIYMTTGRIVNATIKLNSEKNISDLIDWFGHDVVISKKENEITATMKVNENALIYWALQYGEHVEVLKPITSRNKIREMINKISNKYSE